MLLGAFTAAHGQLITPKTVPVHQDEQFAIFPSTRAGMGGVSIALDDSLADPFVNPAKTWSRSKAVLFTAPYNHDITGGHGGGRTLPIGAIATRGEWAASGVIAWQDLNHSSSSNALNMGSSDNRYAQLGVARHLPGDVTIGASAYYARIHAVDGLDVLYDGSDGVAQRGTLTDYRLGMTKQWGENRLELLALADRYDVTNAVARSSIEYSPGSQGMVSSFELDHDLDRTNTVGAHAQYVQAIGDGWKVGWLATINRLSHPKIPNYTMRNTPTLWFDPGTTNAFNFGAGLSRSWGTSTFGFDFIAEPMTSNTWAETSTELATETGSGVIAAGGHTVDNHFVFANSKWRIGFAHDFAADSVDRFGFQLGMSMYNVNYQLKQRDNVMGTSRTGDEGWHEFSPTFGLHWLIRGVNLQYNYRLNCTRDCIDLGTGDKITVPAASVGVIAAPTAGVHVDGGTSRMHQIMLSVPIR